MQRPIRICLISVEIFAWGKYGGFGKATRIIGRELVKRGYDVYAVVPRRLDQKDVEILDGIKVHGFLPSQVLKSGEIYKKINADIYHSCEPSMGTWLAMANVPTAKHMVTSRDPKSAKEWWQEFLYPSKSKWQVITNYLYENNYLIKKAVRQADALYVPAIYLIGKVQQIYRYPKEISFLPTPTEVPAAVNKSAVPVVLAMGRIDPRKRLEMVLDLAIRKPHVEFHVAGKSRVKAYEESLHNKYGHYPNIKFLGFLDQFSGDAHQKAFSEAWILINTSAREGLPNAFIEAVCHKCAILSSLNPDNFTTRFGYHVQDDDFERGLDYLLKDENWKSCGEIGYAYARNVFDVNSAMNAHGQAYQSVLQGH